MSFSLEDSGGNLWSINASDNGLLTATSLGAGTAPTPEISGPTTTWQLLVTTNGNVEVSSVTYDSTQPLYYSFLSSGGFGFNMFVDDTGHLYLVPPVDDEDNLVMFQPTMANNPDFNVTVF